jgi:hypothetical protein
MRIMREPLLINGRRPATVRAPLLSEHTELVLRELLELDEDAINLLYAAGAIS